jgi:aspartokinase-like uncharacterized kinase
MWIVKIGGSLAQDPLLPVWLEQLSALGGGRVVIVPGGAGYADAARLAQNAWQLNDLAAHNMAILGMGQFAFMLHGLCPELVLASDERELERTVHSGRVALWMPLEMLRREVDELTTWDVTSDSLSLWLANRLNAERVILVKSCPVTPFDLPTNWHELATAGVVDRRFPGLAADAADPIHLLERSQLIRLRELLLDAPAAGVVGN